MQVGETVATVTVGSLAGFLARLRQNGAPDDTAIDMRHHKNAGGWTLSADFEPVLGIDKLAAASSGWQGRPPAPSGALLHSDDARDGAVPA